MGTVSPGAHLSHQIAKRMSTYQWQRKRLAYGETIPNKDIEVC